MMIARAKPAPPRMSSMPYGPPETMKYVAAISGSKRILRRAGLSVGGIDVNVTKSDARFGAKRRGLLKRLELRKQAEVERREGETREKQPTSEGTSQVGTESGPSGLGGTYRSRASSRGTENSAIIRNKRGEMAEWLKAAVC